MSGLHLWLLKYSIHVTTPLEWSTTEHSDIYFFTFNLFPAAERLDELCPISGTSQGNRKKKVRRRVLTSVLLEWSSFGVHSSETNKLTMLSHFGLQMEYSRHFKCLN